MIVCLLKNDYISSIELPNKIQGQYWLKDDSSPSKDNIVAIEGVGDHWLLKANKNVKFENNMDRIQLRKDTIYKLWNNNEWIFVYIENEYPEAYFLKYKINLSQGIITLGRNNDNTIVVNHKSVSGNHFKLVYNLPQWKVIDESSTNGTYVNNRRVSEKVLRPGDVIYVPGIKIIIGTDFISINKNPLVTIDKRILVPMTFNSYISDDEYELEPVQYFYRSPRIKKDVQTKEMKIDNPPDNQIGDEIPLMMVIGPSMTMGMASLTTAIFSIINAQATGNMMNAIPTIVMSLSMLLGTVMWPIITKRYEKKRKRRKEEERQIKYGKYLDFKEREITACASEQQRLWNENFPSIEACVRKIITLDRTLFERNAKHNDFLEFRLGLGKRSVDLNIQYSQKSFSLVEDHLKTRLYQICDGKKIIDNVPITISLLNHDFLGIIGSEEKRYRLLKNMLVQLFAYYSYDDVKLVFIYNEKDTQYDYFKWLPYCFDNDRQNRYIARNVSELKDLTTFLELVITERENLRNDDLEDAMPYYIIISLDNELSKKAGFIKRIAKQKQNIHFSVVQLGDELKELSKDCKTVIDLSRNGAYYYDLSDMTGYKTYFIPDHQEVNVEYLAHKLANIHLDLMEEKTNLPDMVGFMQMYNVGKVEHLNALSRWKENDPTQSLEAPIGIDNLGELFNLDLHQKYHGPHGLVAGMTGSGKSEFIMTYILSMAINYHPDEVAFILIDYKGGGMAKAFENLPHTAGIITNLDGSSVKRSLISIESELKRRQSIFASTSARLNISNLDIYKYQGLYRNQQVDEPLQHLFIISDEFAELKTQQPEFMAQLISAARIGRSLGVHLILATQKPSGVVDDQIWSNSRFRICLKVQERSDSMDMLKRPDAAEIQETGRFYLQVGYNELFDIGQSAWAGAPYYPSDKPVIENNNSVDIIGMNGHILQSVKIDHRQLKYPQANKQLDVITEYLRKIADEENIHVRPLWLEPIPEKIYINELINKYRYIYKNRYELNPIIGEFDDPAKQSQHLLSLPITKGGNTLIYGVSRAGKTTLLETIVYSLITNYSAREVNLYLLDFASETLKAFEDAPQVGDVLLSYDEEKVVNLLRMLNKELSLRKNLFSNYGGDIVSYNKESTEKKHSIVVMINNYNAFSELYDEREDAIIYLAREGAKYGIYFILTTSAVTGIRFRLSQNFSQIIALQMNDESDYITLIGKTEGLFPAKYKGRGLIKVDDTIYEFQTAHISKNLTSFNQIRDFCKKASRTAKYRAQKVPVLPDYVTIDFMRPYVHNDLNLPIGIEELSLDPYYYRFDQDYINMLVTNEPEDFLISLLDMQNMLPNKHVYVLDPRGNMPNSDRYTVFKGEKNIVDGIHQLFNIVLTRNNTYKDAVDSKEVAKTFEPLLIVLTSVNALLNAYDDETNQMIELLLLKGKSEYKMNIIVAENSKTIGSLSYSAWFKESVNTQNVLWYCSGITDQYVFGLNNKGSDLYAPLSDMFGYGIKNGNYTKVKFITQKKD